MRRESEYTAVPNKGGGGWDAQEKGALHPFLTDGEWVSNLSFPLSSLSLLLLKQHLTL